MARRDRNASTFRTIVIFVIIAVLAVFAYVRMADRDQGPDLKTPLAQCLTDKGVKFYGAYWCPHCAAQKKLFGRAMSKVTYVECAIPGDPRAQTQACKDANIEGYPTWTFPDGSRLSGEISLQRLAEKSGCPYGDAQPATNEPAANEPAAAAPAPTGTPGAPTINAN